MVHRKLFSGLPRQKTEEGVFYSLIQFPPACSMPMERKPGKKGVSLLFPTNTLMAA